MADRLVTIKVSGGDYTSLITAEATEDDTALTASQLMTFECYKGDYESSGVENWLDEDIVFSGWTGITSTAYIVVQSPIAERDNNGLVFDGSGDYARFTLRNDNSGGAGIINLGEDYCRVTGINVACYTTASYSDRLGITMHNGNCTLQDVMVIAEAPAAELLYAIDSWPSGYGANRHNLFNVAVVNGTGTGKWANGVYSRGMNAYNCTVVNCNTGFNGQHSTHALAVNCIAYNCSSNDFSGSFSSSSDYNLSKDTTALGTNKVINATLTFEDTATYDYHLVSGDTDAIGAGEGPDDDATVPSEDIDGDSRTGGSSDIGFDLYVAVGGDTNVLASTKALTLTTYPATISAGTNVLAGTKALTLTTYQATVNAETNVNAAVKALTLTTYPATIAADTTVAAAVKALVLTTYPAAVDLGVNVNATVKALTLTTYPAAITYDRDVSAAVKALTLTTYPATITAGSIFTIPAGVVNLVLTTYPAAITFDRNVGTAVKELTLTTHAARIDLVDLPPPVSANSPLNINLGNVPDIDDPQVYEAVLNVHSAIDTIVGELSKLD